MLANLAFVTSSLYAGDLGGLPGADAICAAHASDAGLAGTYRAWISTDAGNPLTRFGNARGWVRPDGKPFTDTLTRLVQDRQIFYPLWVTEKRTPTYSGRVWTGTRFDGTPTFKDCVGWTSSDAGSIGLAGTRNDTALEWTESVNSDCSQRLALYCFAIDLSVPVAPLRPSVSRHAFVSSGAFALDGGGLPTADRQCADEAGAAGLPGTYRAMLATSTETAASRFRADAGPWVRLDDVTLMPTAAAFLSATRLEAGLNVGSDGGYRSNQYAWTGAATPDALGTSSCINFTSSSNAEVATAGTSSQPPYWFNALSLPCDFQQARLYCLQE